MNSRLLVFAFGLMAATAMVGAADLSDIPVTPQPGFNLTFKGGTPHELAQEMKAAAARHFREPDTIFPINVVVPKELEDVAVPPLTMQSVDPQTVFNTLNLMWQNEGLQWVSTGGKAWVLQTAPDRRKAQAFFVGHLLKKYKIEDITTAVKTTWELGGTDARRKPELKFHKDTEMLIALADGAQLVTVNEVLSQLRMGLETDSKRVPR
jgi:hypothetical protein